MKKTISKLSILFIFAILIPGSVLTYFSIQNISSMKDLTVKRVEEDQKAFASEFSRRFDDRLLMDAERYFTLHDSLSSRPIEAMLILDSLDFVRQPFIMNRYGRFVWPNFLRPTLTSRTKVFSDEFIVNFSEAESAEFADQDYSNAGDLYRQALMHVTSDFESASAMNGLARALIKSGLIEHAFRQYRTLVRRFGSVVDVTGSPFAHYALHQLIRFSSRDNPENMSREIDDVLSRILNGIIPLTAQTETILQSVETWCGGLDTTQTESRGVILDKVERIRSDLEFVRRFEDHLAMIIVEDMLSTLISMGRYNAFTLSYDDKPILLVLNGSNEGSGFVGFSFELETVKQRLIREMQSEMENLDLKAEIVAGNQYDTAGHGSMVLVRELSPFVPGWRLQIQHRNPSAVIQYITRRRLIYTFSVALLLAGMFLGVVLVLRDISREQKLSRLRSDFVSNVTHELKTPLTSIRMFAETLHMDRVKRKTDQKEYLSIIVSESERLTRLINTVLDFSKIEQGEKQYHMTPVHLSHVVEDAMAALDHRLKELGFLVKMEIEPDISLVADGDAMEQAVLNLVSNAMKYSGDGKEITVSLGRKGDEIYLQVQDRGMGIPESKLPHIFDKYYRAHGGHAKDQGGSGLGLTVVKHIVDAHQGRIEVKSKMNEGSTFTLILPVRDSNTEDEVHA